MEEEMRSKIERIRITGLLEVVRDWVKSKRFVKVGDIQREFSVSYEAANCVLAWLIDEAIVEKEPTFNRGHRVLGRSLGLNIYLLDHNHEMVQAWKERFYGHEEISAQEGSFARFMDSFDVDCVVSPGNAFGQMDGGYDLAITDYFGASLQKAVQRKIAAEFYGEQPVGSSVIVDIPGTEMKLIHTPTMRVPEPIKDPLVIYQCMRATLMLAIKEKVRSMVIPAFGACCGKLPPKIVAEMMGRGYEQILYSISGF
ncbi:MAG: macro domain-containing protein [Bacilli bacterium]|nr:macro domain-containing protein [Bacilli bacterium]